MADIELETLLSGLTEEATPDNAADFLLLLDTSGADLNKVKPSSILAAERIAAAVLTGKRVTPRIGTTASSATPTPDADAHDIFTVTALATNATFAAPAGTPTDGQPLIIRIKDNGTSRTLAFNAIYRAIGVTLPTATVISKTIYIGLIFNSADTKWDILGVAIEA